MKRLNLFKSLINNLETKKVKDYFKFIGTGNPMADILIIGKEASISKEKQPNQYKTEIANNFSVWKKMIEKNDFNQDKIPYLKNIEYQSPLYPYKGQVLQINNGKNGGTSRTWMTYQKLYNRIYNKKENHNIDFHNDVFINATPSPNTANADTQTIDFRKNEILSSDFIKNFPVIILAGTGYFNTLKDGAENLNEIEEIFEVRFHQKKLAENKVRQPYWIHWNMDKTRLLINTYQLSIGIADILLDEIAKEINHSGLLNKI